MYGSPGGTPIEATLGCYAKRPTNVGVAALKTARQTCSVSATITTNNTDFAPRKNGNLDGGNRSIFWDLFYKMPQE
ncbi:hypothetical protein PGT21_020439 [Puccinia graminis f. sp. tritici]|uniref:Uncharacterized protein n=1 Tax=Puccinia graminis f. sp. tritici TaxID=56615 RepID=A0A5B0QAW9_PUCGR|nr:hypothetical protein PGT21_020439 [Puccinia graminis f. sp. tritici]